jgi:hypothetical protein
MFAGRIKPTCQAWTPVPSIVLTRSVLLIILCKAHIPHTDIVTFLTVAKISIDICGIQKLITVFTRERHFTLN